MNVLFHLIAKPGGDFDKFDAAFVACLCEFFNGARDFFVRRRFVFAEQRRQLRQRQRLSGGEQGGFDDALELGGVGHRVFLLSYSDRDESIQAVASDFR